MSRNTEMTALATLKLYTKVDLDALDVSTLKRSVSGEDVRFDNITGNQLITLGAFQALPAGTQIELLASAVKAAKTLEPKLDAVEADPDRDFAGLVVDILTAKMVFRLVKHLTTVTGTVMAQVFPSLISSTAATVAHARRLAHLFVSLSDNKLQEQQVCIKIPATVAGLEACRILEVHYKIRTLATTTFCVEQGLAASQAGCRYVSPYINSLEAFFYEAEDVPFSERKLADTTRSFVMVRALQCALRSQKSALRVLAAAFVEDKEVLKLTGIDQVTLPLSVMAQLERPTMAADKQTVQDALQLLNAEETCKEIEFATDWFQGKGLLELKTALQEPRCSAMLHDALSRFGKAEALLRDLVTEAIAQH